MLIKYRQPTIIEHLYISHTFTLEDNIKTKYNFPLYIHFVGNFLINSASKFAVQHFTLLLIPFNERIITRIHFLSAVYHKKHRLKRFIQRTFAYCLQLIHNTIKLNCDCLKIIKRISSFGQTRKLHKALHGLQCRIKSFFFFENFL